MTVIEVSFGDCDPAGIVFYPNVCRWLDKAFHDWLRPFGGHASLCAELGAVGLGLFEVNVRFRSPVRDGDAVTIERSIKDWGRKSLTLSYVGRVGETIVFEAQETRGLFKSKNGDIFADEMTGFRERLAAVGEE